MVVILSFIDLVLRPRQILMTNASTNSGDAANSLCVSMEDASISFTSVTPVLRAQSQSGAGALLSRTASLCPFVRRVELGMAPVDLTSSQANIVGYRISLRNPVKIFRGLVLEVEQIRIENGTEIHVQAQMGEDLLLQCWTGCPGERQGCLWDGDLKVHLKVSFLQELRMYVTEAASRTRFFGGTRQMRWT